MSDPDLFPRADNHLTAEPKHDALFKTYLGMAHIAGTGPAGKTCRQCIHFGRDRHTEDGFIEREPYRYFDVNRLDENRGRLKPHWCLRPILGKAYRLIPGTASACRLFEPNPKPPPARKLRKRKAKGVA